MDIGVHQGARRPSGNPGRVGRLMRDLLLAFKLAIKELRGGFSGIYVLVGCIALGVGTIAAIGALTQALNTGISARGQILLGGDVAFTLVQRRARTEERHFLESLGTVSEIVTLRAMARPDFIPSNSSPASEQAPAPVLVELKGVDDLYPLYGALVTEPSVQGQKLEGLLIDERLALRLKTKPGGHIYLGTARLKIAGVLKTEPDALSGRAAFGPRIVVPHHLLAKTALLAPGAIMRWHYRVRLEDLSNAGHAMAAKAVLQQAKNKVAARFPEAGFTARDRLKPSALLGRAITMFSQFLTLIGLAALLAGGLGVANAVAALIAKKRKTIAIMKSLGAPAHLPFLTYLMVIVLVTSIGIVAGLVFGAVVPFVIEALYADILPLPFQAGFFPQIWATAAGFGLLVSVLFLLWPLGQSLKIHPAELFRQQEQAAAPLPGRKFDILRTVGANRGLLVAIVITLIGLVTLAILSADARFVAVFFCIGAFFLYGAFHVFARMVPPIIRAIPRPKRLAFKLARRALTGPGTLLYPVMVSLGMGLTLIVALALVRGAVLEELGLSLPERAPDYFFLDISQGDYQDFSQLIRKQAPNAALVSAPMLRGRITALNGAVPVVKNVAPGVRWVLRGDRGVTYSKKLPEGSILEAGPWWPKTYDGPPLVSLEAEAAEGLGLHIGDTISVNILGRVITARVHNLRSVKWDSLAMNFVMVFSPNTLAGAPNKLLATMSLPEVQSGKTKTEREAKIVRLISEKFPTVTAVRVRDAIDAVKAIVQNVALAITLAGGLTLISGALVLAGALAAAEHQRSYEAAVFKTLGATRRQILFAHMAEYALLGLLTAVAAMFVGGLAAYVIVAFVMELSFHFATAQMLLVLGLTLVVVVLTGLASTWRVLSAKSTTYLAAD